MTNLSKKEIYGKKLINGTPGFDKVWRALAYLIRNMLLTNSVSFESGPEYSLNSNIRYFTGGRGSIKPYYVHNLNICSCVKESLKIVGHPIEPVFSKVTHLFCQLFK